MSIKGVLVECGPGGAIGSQVNDGLATTYEAGQSFSELPGTAAASAPMPA